MKRKISGRPSGFTIIEVLIVLAIASLILLIIFLAVPTLQRNTRNHERKNAVDYVASEMGAYYGNHGHYPLSGGSGPGQVVGSNGSPAVGSSTALNDRVSFVNGLLQSGTSSFFTIRYSDESGPHTFLGNLDEISIESGHKCNPNAQISDPGNYPLDTANGGDNDYRAYVVWTRLENGGSNKVVYCLDNAFN